MKDGFFDSNFFESFNTKTYEAKKINTIINTSAMKLADFLVVNAKMEISFYAIKRTN